MRILIVDDDPGKVFAVSALLTANGVASSDIVVAEHASAARIALECTSVDVLLIDVLLPVRAGTPPRGENSVELLLQIVDDGTTTAPRYIVGMTASVDALDEFSEVFKSLVSQVLHIAPGHHAWEDSILALLKLVKRVEEAKGNNDYDVCVLNALRSPELEAVYSSWPLELGAEHIIRRNIVCRTGTLSLDGVQRRIACAHLSQMGPIAATHAATALLLEYRPRVLLMTGICGGFIGRADIGDIVVAEKSWDWQAGKWDDEGRLQTASDQRDASPELIAIAKGVDACVSRLHSNYAEKKPAVHSKVVVGPMVTGSAVVASPDIQRVFMNQHRKMLGVDMECYGLYYAAANHSGAPVQTICVKAVSDLADRNKADDFQKYCSYISAAYALEILKKAFS